MPAYLLFAIVILNFFLVVIFISWCFSVFDRWWEFEDRRWNR